MKKYLILIVSVVLVSCKQFYEPEIDSEPVIITIQGLLTNEKGNVSVIISKAVPFDTASMFAKDGNATVTVSDDEGNVYSLYNNGRGVYINSNFTGEIGRTYTLHVITQAGDEFVSSPEKMPEAFTIDSIYGKRVTKDIVYETDRNGSYITRDTAVEFYTDLGSSGAEMPRCRFESLVTVLYYYIIFDCTPDKKVVYGWFSSYPNKDPDVTSDKFIKTQNVVKGHNLCFFVDKRTIHPDTIDVYVAGWLYALIKYNLNEKSQTYYQNITDQMKASDKLFAPIPSQLPSNISCVNNTNKKVIGNFEVSSIERKYYRCIIEKKILLVEKDKFPGLTYKGEVIENKPLFFNY
jgi:hypothetical protein